VSGNIGANPLSYKGDDGFRIVITPYNKIQKTTGKITEKKIADIT